MCIDIALSNTNWNSIIHNYVYGHIDVLLYIHNKCSTCILCSLSIFCLGYRLPRQKMYEYNDIYFQEYLTEFVIIYLHIDVSVFTFISCNNSIKKVRFLKMHCNRELFAKYLLYLYYIIDWNNFKGMEWLFI